MHTPKYVRIDGTTEEAFNRSLKAMKIQLCQEDRSRLSLALSILRLRAMSDELSVRPTNDVAALAGHARMCVHGLSFEEIIAREDALRSPEGRALRRIQEKAQGSYASLTEPERVWFTVTPLLISIRNGGLISYYYNSYADHLDHCMQALEALNAGEMLELVRRVNSWFGECVPKTLEARNALIASWTDFDGAFIADREQIEADRVDQALSAYIAEHGLVGSEMLMATRRL
jgi:hypothetical protein